MALHQPPCNDIGTHISIERADTEALELPVGVFLRVAVAEFDAEHAVPVIDPVDATDRLEHLGWAPGELVESYGK